MEVRFCFAVLYIKRKKLEEQCFLYFNNFISSDLVYGVMNKLLSIIKHTHTVRRMVRGILETVSPRIMVGGLRIMAAI